MVAQAQLPGVPQNRKMWLQSWIEVNYPNRETFDRQEARQESSQQMPRMYWPSVDNAYDAWYRDFFNKTCKDTGYGFEDGRRGQTVAYQMEMPFDDFAALCVGQLTLAKEDMDAVRRRLEAYVERNNLTIDIDATWSSWRQAVGL
jgi:hypothetical protein